MLAYIRSCKYCGNNPQCKLKQEIRDRLKDLKLDATAVVNCKKAIPYASKGERIYFSVYNPTPEDAEPKEEGFVVSGRLVGYIFDKYGHVRNYVVKIPRKWSPYFEIYNGPGCREDLYWIDGESAANQFPEAKLSEDEILVFPRFTAIQRLEK